MLGQIRRHIAKKNEKLFYIFVLFIVAFGISIVHYMFLVGELSVIKLMGNLFLGMGVFIVFTVIYALIIKKITDYIVDRRK